jgi:cytochrome c peroxidase
MDRTKGLVRIAIVGCVAAVMGCSDEPPTTPPLAPTASLDRSPAPGDPNATTPQLVRALAASRGIVAMASEPRVRPALVHLGQALAFDPILGGNRNVACTTCHLPAFELGDAKSLSVGEGGIGFGPDRTHPQGIFIARNAPAFFNLAPMRHLFWDGRIESDAHGHVSTPAGAQVTAQMQRSFEYGAISAIGMFPVTSRAEMRGMSGNELAAIPDEDNPAIWAGLMRRLGNIPEYRRMFQAAYPDRNFEDLTFADASNAIGGFLIDGGYSANTPWDRFLNGNDRALTPRQLEGARTFLTLKCSVCHTGALLSDDDFHNVAVAQIGPGEGDGLSTHDDFGRMRVTGNAVDRYRFRTSPLRNVELTGPYGHDGSIATLRGFVEHYSESDLKLLNFDPMTLDPSLRGTLQANATNILAQRDTLLDGVVLTPVLVDQLMDYMSALTDEAARDLNHLVPRSVPSGLPVLPPRQQAGHGHDLIAVGPGGHQD